MAPTARDKRSPAQVDPETLAYLPAHVLAERVRSRALSAAALLDCYLDRIRRFEPKLHAFVAVHEQSARIAAAAADRALEAGQPLGPLHGIPVALKDLIEMQGSTTTGG
jgi:aspartyl-tRNA(Asn)/glutamyl-tRNA(Gln) amidotransferase subunit A